MDNFNENAYEQFIDNLTQSQARHAARLESIQPNSRILVFNSMWAGRCPEKVQSWKTVEKVTHYSDGILEITCADGKTVSSADVMLVSNTAATETLMICLNDRQREFVEALNRAADTEFQVYADWEKDSFVVVNTTNDHEYRVTLKTLNGKVFGSCICKDFNRRNRLCKHLSITLQDAFAGILPRIGLVETAVEVAA